MKKIKYRNFLENLTNEIGYTPAHRKLSEILNYEITANALSNRYTNDGYIKPEYMERIKEYYKNEKRLGNKTEECVMLDYYPAVFGSCIDGVFTPSENKEKLMIPKKAFFENFESNKTYSIFTMKGNTMEPFIYDGDNIIVEYYTGGQIEDNRPYICCLNDKFYIRRLVDNINQVVMMPENKMYDIIKITREDMKDLTIIGQIVGLMRNLR